MKQVPQAPPPGPHAGEGARTIVPRSSRPLEGRSDLVLPPAVLDSVEAVVAALQGTDVTSLELEAGTLKVQVKRAAVLTPAGHVPGPVGPSAEPLSPSPEPEVIVPIIAELVGRFLLSSVQRGDDVEAGAVVACIESMSLMNDVRAPVAGRIVEILVEPGHPVEYGQVLMALVPGLTPASTES